MKTPLRLKLYGDHWTRLDRTRELRGRVGSSLRGWPYKERKSGREDFDLSIFTTRNDNFTSVVANYGINSNNPLFDSCLSSADLLFSFFFRGEKKKNFTI